MPDFEELNLGTGFILPSWQLWQKLEASCVTRSTFSDQKNPNLIARREALQTEGLLHTGKQSPGETHLGVLGSKAEITLRGGSVSWTGWDFHLEIQGSLSMPAVSHWDDVPVWPFNRFLQTLSGEQAPKSVGAACTHAVCSGDPSKTP